LQKKTGFKLIKCKTITNFVWLRMQLIHLFNYPTAGEPSLYWSKYLVRNIPFKPSSASSKLIDKLTRRKIIHMLNKIFDMLSVGDNYLIILMKNY